MSSASRPFRFGVHAPFAYERNEFLEIARKAEALGYHVLTLPDHFSGDGIAGQLAAIPAVMAAAAATTTLRVGTLVLGNDFRHPAVLAKDLLTVDLLSGGRLEVGVGAGWLATDYAALGLPFEPPGSRIGRLEEAVDILRAAFTEPVVDHAGQHFRVTSFAALPRPTQSDGPPILIGGGGPRMLRLAAQTADIVGINPSLNSGVMDSGMLLGSPTEMDQKVDLVRAASADRSATPELNVRVYNVKITDRRDAAAERIAERARVDVEVVTASPHVLVGSVEAVCDDVLERRERWGLSYLTVGAWEMEAFAPVVAKLSSQSCETRDASRRRSS